MASKKSKVQHSKEGAEKQRQEKLKSQLEELEKELGPELLDDILGPDGEELPEAKCERTGWRWQCPICETWNNTPSPNETDYCSYCGKEVKLIKGE